MTVRVTIAMRTGCACNLATGTISWCFLMTMCAWVCHAHVYSTQNCYLELPWTTLNYQELSETFRTYQDVPAPTITYHDLPKTTINYQGIPGTTSAMHFRQWASAPFTAPLGWYSFCPPPLVVTFYHRSAQIRKHIEGKLLRTPSAILGPPGSHLGFCRPCRRWASAPFATWLLFLNFSSTHPDNPCGILRIHY